VIDSALEAIRSKGVIVLVAECIDGYGDNEFYEWMKKIKDFKGIERVLKENFTVGGYGAYLLMRALEKAKVILVSVLPDYYTYDVFKLKPAKTVNEALRDALDTVGRKEKVLTIPYGNVAMPVVKLE